MAVRGGGKIVNIASIVGAVSTPFGGAYCSSKAAVISASDVMRIELRPFGIDVITVWRHLTPTPPRRQLITPSCFARRCSNCPGMPRESQVLPGAVVSQIGVNNDAKLPLLPLRFFEPVLKLIQARAQASQTEASTPTDVFAKHVVRSRTHIIRSAVLRRCLATEEQQPAPPPPIIMLPAARSQTIRWEGCSRRTLRRGCGSESMRR